MSRVLAGQIGGSGTPRTVRYRVQAPDGKTLVIEGPEGASQEEVIRQAQSMYQAEESGGLTGLMSQANRGISAAMGAPVDLVNQLVPERFRSEQPFLGSRSIQSGMESLGVPVAQEEPEGIGEQAFYGAGAGIGGLVPISKGTQMLSRAKGLMGQMGRTMSDPFLRAPVSSVVAETTAGAGAGTGVGVAEEVAPDSPAAATTGALIGGLAGGIAPGAAMTVSPTMNAARLGRRLTPEVVRPFTAAGARERAAGALQSRSPDPRRAAQLMEERSALSPAQRTGEPGLIEAEQSVAGRTAEGAAAYRRRLGESRQSLTGETEEAFGVSRLADDVERAQQRAESQLASLAPERQATEASAIYARELDASLNAARAQESALWGEVPQNVRVSMTGGRQTYQRIRRELPKAMADDMPPEARQILGRQPKAAPEDALIVDAYGRPAGAAAEVGDTETVREIHGLYSKLRETARHARASQEFNRARISDEIADALWTDLTGGDAPGDVGAALEAARRFSADLNQTFRRGNVGRLLGYERAGGPRVQDEALLTGALRRGERGAVALDELREAVRFAGRSGVEADQAIEDYLKRKFVEYAAPRGQLSANRVQDFLRNNSEILDRFPGFKAEMEKTASVQRSRETVERLKLGFSRAFRSNNPEREIRRMAREANDPATFRRGFVDYALGGDAASGERLMAILNSPRNRAAVEAVLGEDELRRLRRIGRELSIVEGAEKATLRGGPVIEDTAAQGATILGRIMGAQVGGKIGASSAGGSLQSAQIGSSLVQRNIARFVRDKADELIVAAMDDPELFRALLTDPISPQSTNANRLIREWTEDALQRARDAVPPWMVGYMSAEMARGAQEMRQ